MLQLVYISTARAEAVDETMIGSILETSRENNQRHQISGLLVSGGRRFLQALEGPDTAVASTYVRIGADSRHGDIVELARRSVSEREFGDWAMAHTQGGDSDDDAALRRSVEQMTRTLRNGRLRALFTSFAEAQGLAG